MKIKIIAYILIIWGAFSCRQLPVFQEVDGGVVALVGDEVLTRDAIEAALPQYITGDDSVVLAQRYVDRWIERQVKVLEAERIFTSSEHEVEAMVDAYRQTLLIRKLDQYYINSAASHEISKGQIVEYYRQNEDNFRLDRNIVKGEILKLPVSYSDTDKLKSLMGSNSRDSKQNLISISEKNQEFELQEYTREWIDYDEFIAMLPVVRDKNSGAYMRRKGIQTLKDDEWCYLFEITSYRSVGYVAPLERVEGVIRKILTNEYHLNLIRQHEEQLYESAQQHGVIYQVTQ